VKEASFYKNVLKSIRNPKNDNLVQNHSFTPSDLYLCMIISISTHETTLNYTPYNPFVFAKAMY